MDCQWGVGSWVGPSGIPIISSGDWGCERNTLHQSWTNCLVVLLWSSSPCRSIKRSKAISYSSWMHTHDFSVPCFKVSMISYFLPSQRNSLPGFNSSICSKKPCVQSNVANSSGRSWYILAASALKCMRCW